MTHPLAWRRQAQFWGGTALVFFHVALHILMDASTADVSVRSKAGKHVRPKKRKSVLSSVINWLAARSAATGGAR
ncbi:MAG: hypothetical protein J2O46_05770 [Nocardioides sp.]|nr:hypothetical protein [Nocardioides sp.]